MDTIGWYVATMHSLIGHDKTAAFIGQPSGDKDACLICQYERSPDERKRQAVINALAPREPESQA